MALAIDAEWRTSAQQPANLGNPAVLGALPSRKVTVSAVIPTLNEAENLPHVLPRIPAWVDEVVLVDGRSTDNTVEVARRLLPNVRIVHEERKGKGVALRTGFAAATGDIIVMLDADGSTDPEEIPNFVWALLTGADYAKGSRFIQGGGTADMSFHRQMGNWGFTRSVQVLFGGRYSDLCYGYNAFWTRVLPQLELDADGFEIETLMNVRALRAGLRVTEVPSFEAERINGMSNLNALRDGWRVMMTILREWSKPGARRSAEVEVMIGRPAYLHQLVSDRRQSDRRRADNPEVVKILGRERRQGERRLLLA